MRIKKFVDEDMVRLIRRVKQELGDDAVIISTSRLADGQTELVAALEDEEICFEEGGTAEIYSASYKDNRIRERLDYHEADINTRSCLTALCRQKALELKENDDTAILTAVFSDIFSSYEMTDNFNPVKVFVGIQGSGKTTSLVKTAVLAKKQHLSIGIISTDGLRAGTNNQLKAFAQILEAEFCFAKESEDIKKALKFYQDKYDLVLVDTPGYNPFIEQERQKLKSLLDSLNGEVILTLDAGYNAYDACEAATIYSRLGATCLLPTKLDLCRRIGGFLSVATKERYKLGWACVSSHMGNGLTRLDNILLARMVMA